MTGCQAESAEFYCDLSSRRCAVSPARASLLLDYDDYGMDMPSHSAIIQSLQAQSNITTLQVVVNHRNAQQPQHLYRYLRGLGTSFLQFIPLVESDEKGNLSAASVQSEAWGAFLNAVFDIWVREDMEQIRIPLFDSTLAIWRGLPSQVVCDVTMPITDECRACSLLRFCRGDCPEHRVIAGKSALCAGYHHFFAYSAPYMKALRDLLKQRRAPRELMAMLNQCR